MKRTKTNFYSSLFISVFIASGMMGNGYGQQKTLQKTFTWKSKVNQDVRFTFNNYDCDLIIHTWDKAEIEYRMSVDAVLKSPDDASRLSVFIDDLELKGSEGNLEFDNRFWKSRKTMAGRKTMGLKGVETIRFSEFNMKGELWIPSGCNLYLISKYSGIELEDIGGSVNLDLYNDKLYGGDINSNLSINAKYSTLEFKGLNDIKADLYSVDMEAEIIGNLNVSSKYSRFSAGQAGKIEIIAYSDKYLFENTLDINFTDKYSSLSAGVCANVAVDCYNSTLTLKSVKNCKLNSKYSKYYIDEMDDCNIANSYSDNFQIGSIRALNITDTKYGVYKIDELTGSLRMDLGYSDKYIILKTGSEFKGVDVNGKYINIRIAIPADLDYTFKANVNYPKFDINEEAMNVKTNIRESSQLELDAIKGTEREGMASFIVNGYDMAIAFTDKP